MKFVELKKSIIANKIYSCYNVFGNDDFLIKSSTDIIFNYLTNKDELSKIVLSTETLKVDSLNNILNSSSFFGQKKLVLIKDLDVKTNKDILNAILNYAKLPCENTILAVVSTEKICEEKNLDFLNASGQNLCFVDCSKLDKPMLTLWIKARLKELLATMSESAISLLIDYTNGDLSHISIELEKLVSFADKKQIEDYDVEKLVTKEVEYSVFELTENLGKKNSAKAFQILEQMLNDKKMQLSVFGLIQNFFRRMFYSSITPLTNAQIAEKLGVKEYAIKKVKECAKYFSKIQLKNIVELCEKYESNIKMGKMSYQNAVHLLIFSILAQ